MAIIAQRDKLFAAPDVRRERHTAFLITHRARQRDGRKGITLRQNQNRLRRGHPAERAEQSQRIGPRQRHAGEMQNSPAQRKHFHTRLGPAAGRQRRNLRLLHLHPAERIFPPALRYAEGADAFAFGQLKRQPFLKRRARVGKFFQQGQARLIFRRQIFHLHAIVQRLSGRADARQGARRGKGGAEEKAARQGQQ